METKQITLIKIWKLILNPMRGNTENGELVAMAYDKQNLITWYNSQFASEPYTDKGISAFDGCPTNFQKSFKKGCQLEWFNPSSDFEEPNHFGHGLSYEWVTEAAIHNANIVPID